MDKRTKELVQFPAANPRVQTCATFPSQLITLHLARTPTVSNLQYQVQQHMYGHHLESRLQKKLQCTTKSLQSIDWQGLEQAFTKLSDNEKIARMKLVYKLLPTRAPRKQESSSTCMRCNLVAETFVHVFKCKCDQSKRTSVLLMTSPISGTS